MWSESKKLGYESLIHKVFYDNDYRDYTGGFTLMVKKGEVYSTPDFIKDKRGFLQNQKSRPRAVMDPSKFGKSIMAALQKEIFPFLSKYFPGFIHAKTSSEIVEQCREKIKPHFMSISVDSSAMDSSQFAPIMDCTDNLFWDKIRPLVHKVVSHNWHSFCVTPTVDIETITERLMTGFKQKKQVVFVNCPTVEAP